MLKNWAIINGKRALKQQFEAVKPWIRTAFEKSIEKKFVLDMACLRAPFCHSVCVFVVSYHWRLCALECCALYNVQRSFTAWTDARGWETSALTSFIFLAHPEVEQRWYEIYLFRFMSPEVLASDVCMLQVTSSRLTWIQIFVPPSVIKFRADFFIPGTT